MGTVSGSTADLINCCNLIRCSRILKLHRDILQMWLKKTKIMKTVEQWINGEHFCADTINGAERYVGSQCGGSATTRVIEKPIRGMASSKTGHSTVICSTRYA